MATTKKKKKSLEAAPAFKVGDPVRLNGSYNRRTGFIESFSIEDPSWAWVQWDDTGKVTSVPLDLCESNSNIQKALPQLLPISKIIPDPNQPRKNFDPEELDELAESVKKHGVLQPIIVRPVPNVPDSYMIVFGERRFRASCLANLQEIPATVRNLTDEEAYELQIIENLQRKDVHPMEEARAFRHLYERGKTVEDIAGKVGKSTRYIAARLKLTDMIPEFQDAFLRDLMEYKDAWYICRANEDVQRALLIEAGEFVDEDDPAANTVKKREEVIDEDEDDIGYWDEDEDDEESQEVDLTGKKLVGLRLYNLKHRLEQQEKDLDTAAFETEDPALIPVAGACGTCKHNSANTPTLFLDNKRICNNAVCFLAKTKRAFQNKLEEYAADPNMLFVYTGYGRPSYGEEQERVQAAEDLGLKVLLRDEYIFAPDDPGPMKSFDEWYRDEYTEELQEEDREGLQEEYDGYVKGWQKELQEYEKFQKGEGVFDAYVVAGWKHQGRVIKVRLPQQAALSDDVPENASASVKAQISKLREREERAKELDSEKVWTIVNKQFEESGIADKFDTSPLSETEIKAACVAVYEELGYGDRDVVRKHLGLTELYGYEVGDKFMNADINTLYGMLRQLMYATLFPAMGSHKKSLTNRFGYMLAEEAFPEQVKAAEQAQEEKAAKRQANLEKKIEQLTNQDKNETRRKAVSQNDG